LERTDLIKNEREEKGGSNPKSPRKREKVSVIFIFQLMPGKRKGRSTKVLGKRRKDDSKKSSRGKAPPDRNNRHGLLVTRGLTSQAR